MKGGVKQGITGICLFFHAINYFHYDPDEGMKAGKKCQIIQRQNVKRTKKDLTQHG